MSDAINGYEPEPYDVPRGTCPECGSRAVKHLVAGVPGSPAWTMGSTPAWVVGVGCCPSPLHNRVCGRCRWEWLDSPDDEL